MPAFLCSVQYVIFKEGITIEFRCRIAVNPYQSVTRTTIFGFDADRFLDTKDSTAETIDRVV
jgi:hypothetical protein